MTDIRKRADLAFKTAESAKPHEFDYSEDVDLDTLDKAIALEPKEWDGGTVISGEEWV